ncbi:YtxH domain-containing protein [Bacillus massilinigeriensis]|uniref:YtxH domain-containing protein n=1 Tax=Bacillus massilionigeriensis TaxID=1805475 RepID=UPI00096B3A3E|nr:YtxH domain-containing protein [Bacillus massilionigeriensis]
MKAKSFLFGLFIGGIASGITTLLSSPSSGKEFRANVKRNKEFFLKEIIELKDQIEQLSKSVIIATNEGKDVLLPFINDIKYAIKAWRKEIEPNETSIQTEIKLIEKELKNLESKISRTID